MLKKIIVVVLSVVILLSLSGCGIKQKLNDKITEKITEGIVDKVTGGDIDIDGDTITAKGENGEEFTFGGSEWPTGKAAALIPEFKKGNVVSVLNSDESCMVALEDVEEEDYNQYIEELRDMGFSSEVSELSTEESLVYYANLDEETFVAASYTMLDKSVSIAVTVTISE